LLTEKPRFIHNAQYKEDEIPAECGWGHIIICHPRKLAVNVQVNNLVMYHQDPERANIPLDQATIEFANFCKSNNLNIASYLAVEALSITLRTRKDSRASMVDLKEFYFESCILQR
jgi:hypothetical protein